MTPSIAARKGCRGAAAKSGFGNSPFSFALSFHMSVKRPSRTTSSRNQL